MTPRFIEIRGTVLRSEPGQQRTMRKFAELINENHEVFRKFFGVELFPGSLNVKVSQPKSIQADLDGGLYAPALKIPRVELVGMPSYLGDGQAWHACVETKKAPNRISCWIFRRINSRVPPNVIEILSGECLGTVYGLANGDPIVIRMMIGLQNR